MPESDFFDILAALRRSEVDRSEEHTPELQSLRHLVCRLLLEKKKLHPTGSHPPAQPNTNTYPHPHPRVVEWGNVLPVLVAPPRPLIGKIRACIFFFNDTATTEIYTLSLHDALPI